MPIHRMPREGSIAESLHEHVQRRAPAWEAALGVGANRRPSGAPASSAKRDDTSINALRQLLEGSRNVQAAGEADGAAQQLMRPHLRSRFACTLRKHMGCARDPSAVRGKVLQKVLMSQGEHSIVEVCAGVHARGGPRLSPCSVGHSGLRCTFSGSLLWGAFGDGKRWLHATGVASPFQRSVAYPRGNRMCPQPAGTALLPC